MLTLSAGFRRKALTTALLDSSVSIDGVQLIHTDVHGSELFWRQLTFGEFDLSEMSISSLTIAISQGNRDWVALPVFPMREMFHTGILVRADAGIESPADLKGKRIGVPEYQQTAAVWCRGILSDEFGVDPRDLHWFMERPPEQSHGGAMGFKPPPGVRLEYIPTDSSIGKHLLSGKLDATLIYLTDKNLVDRSRSDGSLGAVVRPLFRDQAAEAHRYFAKTGIFPINHCYVVRRSIAERDPSLAQRLNEAFLQARESGLRRTQELLAPAIESGIVDAPMQAAIATEIMAYGNRARNVVETAMRFIHEQGLTPRRMTLEEIFAPGTLDA